MRHSCFTPLLILMSILALSGCTAASMYYEEPSNAGENTATISFVGNHPRILGGNISLWAYNEACKREALGFITQRKHTVPAERPFFIRLSSEIRPGMGLLTIDRLNYGWLGFTPSTGSEYEFELSSAQEMARVGPGQRIEPDRFIEFFVNQTIGAAEEYSFVFNSSSENLYRIESGERIPVEYSRSSEDGSKRYLGFPLTEASRSYGVIRANSNGDFSFWRGLPESSLAPNIQDAPTEMIAKSSIVKLDSGSGHILDPMSDTVSCP